MRPRWQHRAREEGGHSGPEGCGVDSSKAGSANRRAQAAPLPSGAVRLMKIAVARPPINPTPRPPSAHPGPATPGPYLAAPPTCVIWRCGRPTPASSSASHAHQARPRHHTAPLCPDAYRMYIHTPFPQQRDTQPARRTIRPTACPALGDSPLARTTPAQPQRVPGAQQPSSPRASLHLRTPRPLACATLGSLRVHARDAPLASAALSWTYPSHHARLVSPRCLSNVVPDVG